MGGGGGKRGGGCVGLGAGVRTHPSNWANYFKSMHFFNQKRSLHPSFWSEKSVYGPERTNYLSSLEYDSSMTACEISMANPGVFMYLHLNGVIDNRGLNIC